MTRMLLAAVVVLVAACDDSVLPVVETPSVPASATPPPSRSTESPTPSPTPAASTPTPPRPTAGPPPPIVREVIAAALARDEARFRSLISGLEIPCVRPHPTATDVVGPTPLCDPQDATGTPYRVFYYSSTHGFAVRETRIVEYLPVGFLGTEVRVEGAAPRSSACCWSETEKYVVGVTTNGGGILGRSTLFRVFLDDRGIVRLHVYPQPMDSYRPLFDLN